MSNCALVMSGGGSKGAFELGAADYLVNDRGLDFQVIAGISTGSLNAVLLAQGRGLTGLRAQVQALKDLWFGIRSERDIFRQRFLGKVLVWLFRNSIFSPSPLQSKIRQSVSSARLRDSGKQLRIGAVELESGAYVSVRQGNPEIQEWTLASASIPVMFPPVSLGGKHHVDGGVRKLAPLEDSFRALREIRVGDGEPDEMYVVLASPLDVGQDERSWNSGLPIGQRAIGILMNEAFREDLSYALAINESVRGFLKLRHDLEERLDRAEAEALLEAAGFPYRPPKFQYVRIWTIVPDVNYSNSLEFDPGKIRAAYDAGQRAAGSPWTEDELRSRLKATKSTHGP